MSVEERLARLDPRRIESRLAALVQVPSLTGTEADAVELVATWLEEIGVDDLSHWVASMSALESDPAYPGREVEREDIPVVAARVKGNRPGPTLLLNGHVDVVPTGDRSQWRREPFSGDVDGDRLFGRGSADMKSGVVAAIEALQLFAQDRDFAGQVVLVAVPGEEDGGTGTLAAIRAGWRGDVCIVTEPTGVDAGPPTLVIAHGGALTYTISVPGRSAHACKRLEGESALEHYLELHAAMRRDERAVNDAESNPIMRALGLPYPTSVGIIRGGEWSSSVMDTLSAEIRVGVSVSETPHEADQRFRGALAEAIAKSEWMREHPPTIDRTGAVFASAALDPDHPLVALVSDAAAGETGTVPVLAGAPYGCDMAEWMHVAGVPTVVYGPGNIVHAHAPNEWVSLSETALVARVLVRAAHALFENGWSV